MVAITPKPYTEWEYDDDGTPIPSNWHSRKGERELGDWYYWDDCWYEQYLLTARLGEGELVGKLYGPSFVIDFDSINDQGRRVWICRCINDFSHVYKKTTLQLRRAPYCPECGSRDLKTVEYYGEEVTLKELSEEYCVPLHVLIKRVEYGMDLDRALVYVPRDKRELEYNGERRTVTEWAREFGLTSTALFKRLDLEGMSVEEALETPLQKWHRTSKDIPQVEQEDEYEGRSDYRAIWKRLEAEEDEEEIEHNISYEDKSIEKVRAKKPRRTGSGKLSKKPFLEELRRLYNERDHR